MRKIVLLFHLLTMAIALPAQPVVNHQFFPRIGHTQILAQADPAGITVGQAGANQVWDFSGLEAIPGAPQTTVANMSPGLTPFGDAFPDANISGIFTDTVEFYTYYRVSPDGWDWIGSGSEFGPLPFADPLTILRPMEFNGSFRDTARLALVYPDLEYHQYIEQEVRYRAYGTLKLPQGTFYNIVLIETSQMEIDSFLAPTEGFYSIDTFYTQGYNWMQLGAPGPLCSYSVSTGSSKLVFGGEEQYSTFGPDYGAQFDIDVPSAVKEPESQPLGAMALAPNPAEGQSWLSLDAERQYPAARLELRDATGRLLRSEPVAIQAGQNRYPISVDGLPGGLYLVSVSNGKTVQTTRLVVR